MIKKMPPRKTENSEKKIDSIDCQIIELLQKDGRISNIDIAKKIDRSEATVRTRLNRLIDEGYIQIVAVSNPLKLGFKAVGFLKINVDIKKTEYVIRELEKLNAVWFIVRATGTADIYTEFVARSMDELNHILFDKIHKIDGVQRTQTSMILKYIKRRYDWGTALTPEK